MNAPRPFRRPESYAAEQITRDMVSTFLRERGYIINRDDRVRQGQTISAMAPDGQALSMRVKLCWRRGDDGREAEHLVTYSAAQLLARVKGDDWIGTIEEKMHRESARGTTHLLLVQRDGMSISMAALIPISEVGRIWTAQRDVSTRLIQEGRLGRRRKNHAMNGASPTIWLQDDRGGEEVANALWSYPGVTNVSALPLLELNAALPEEIADSDLYEEGGCRRVVINAYERDPEARQKCIDHYGAACCICGFEFGAIYGPTAQGHIHVHHLKPVSSLAGPYLVDPIADLRPVCPNCHAVIHLRGACRSIDEMKQMLAWREGKADSAA